jgi:hypothetical protein
MLMMRQVHFEDHGGPDVIRTGEAPVPEPEYEVTLGPENPEPG